MEPRIYPQDRTAYLLIDPYNDYLSEGGKIWPRVEQVATQVGLLDYLGALDAAVQAAGVPVFIVPHRRSAPAATAKTGIIPIPPARHCSAEGCVPRGRTDVLARLAEGLRRAGLSE